MAVVERAERVASADVEAWCRPRRSALVVERVVRTGTGEVVLAAETGPFRVYERRVSWPAGPERRDHGDTVVPIAERTEYVLAVPFFAFVFRPLVHRALRRARPGGDGRHWWAPPVPLDARASAVLGALAVVAVCVGYLGSILTTTITYAGREYDADTAAQGWVLGVVRLDILLTVPLAGLADRRGRRLVLRGVALAGAVGTVVCGLAPGLGWLAAGQVPTRACVTAAALLISVLAVEEMPAGARAYAASALVAAAALGSGMTLMVAAAADVSLRAWRVTFLVPALFVPLLLAATRHIPESRRFQVEQARARRRAPLLGHRRRLAVLAAGGFLLAVFSNPARQFQNDFLRRERDFTAGGISLFNLATNTPGSLGVLLGGRMADLRGRRRTVALGLGGAILATVAMLRSDGAALWAWGVVTSLLAATALPALAVYGPELFPTSARGRANAVTTAAARAGGALGLVLAGTLGRDDQLGRAITWLAIPGLAMVVLVLVAYPETAARELEDLNPEDRPPRVGDASGGA